MGTNVLPTIIVPKRHVSVLPMHVGCGYHRHVANAGGLFDVDVQHRRRNRKWTEMTLIIMFRLMGVCVENCKANYFSCFLRGQLSSQIFNTTSKARSQAKEEEKQTNKQFDQENQIRIEEIKQSFPGINLG